MKQALHKYIALLEQTDKGCEATELKTNRVSIDCMYQASLELHKALNQHQPIESSRLVNCRIEKSFRGDYGNRKIN